MDLWIQGGVRARLVTVTPKPFEDHPFSFALASLSNSLILSGEVDAF